MSYHINAIPKGKLGELSKIKEEFLELEDAVEQDNTILAAVELSDLYGAMKAFALKYHHLTMSDLEKMADATSRAFETGYRQ